MSKKICLTPKQELYFKVIQTYHKANGTFPNNAQLVKAVREAGGKAGSGASQMYATLFLKGAFTGGTVLTDSLGALHSGGNIQSIDVAILNFTPRALRRGRPAGVKNKTKANKQDAIASALLELLKSSPQFNAIAAALNASA